MTLLIVPQMYGGGNFPSPLPKTLQFFRGTVCESCDHGSVKTLLCRRLQVVDQFQHATKSTPRVIQFSASSSVGMLPPPEMAEYCGGRADLGSQRTRPLPSQPCLPPCRGEGAKSLVNLRENRALHSPDHCQAPLDHLQLTGRGADASLGRPSPTSSLLSALAHKPRHINRKMPWVVAWGGRLRSGPVRAHRHRMR